MITILSGGGFYILLFNTFFSTRLLENRHWLYSNVYIPHAGSLFDGTFICHIHMSHSYAYIVGVDKDVIWVSYLVSDFGQATGALCMINGAFVISKCLF